MSEMLTQKQVEEQLTDIHLGSVEVRVKSMACIRRHDASQRQRIAQLEAWNKQLDILLNNATTLAQDEGDARKQAQLQVNQLEAEVTRLKGRIAVDEDSHL